MHTQNIERARVLDLSINGKGYNFGVNQKTVEYSYLLMKKFLKGNSILELGPGEGVMTDYLVNEVNDLTVVEGSKYLADNLKNKYPDLNIVNCLFEEFKPNKKFDFIILGHVLEHVENSVEILKLVKTWLNKDGQIFAAVPNSNSIHRQAAVLMGLLSNQKEKSALDIEYGHRRIYDINEFERDFSSAGLKVVNKGGYWLKPISNKQIEDSWTDEMINAFMLLGESYPEIAAEIYIVACCE